MSRTPSFQRSFRRAVGLSLLATLCFVTGLSAEPGALSAWKEHDNGKHLVVPQKGWTVYLHTELLTQSPDETQEMLKLLEKAYAITNHKEYFAETTEALFGKNDFYPFNLKELTAHDPGMLQVLRKKWGVPE